MKSVLSAHSHIVSKFFACPVQEKIISACLFETSTKSNLFRKRHQNSVPVFLRSQCSIFSSVHLWPAFGTTIRVTAGYQKAGTTSLKGVSGRIFTFSRYFIEASRNFILDFLHKKASKSSENRQRSFSKKYSSRDTIPLIFLLTKK
jgi:hypothetical protein